MQIVVKFHLNRSITIDNSLSIRSLIYYVTFSWVWLVLYLLFILVNMKNTLSVEKLATGIVEYNLRAIKIIGITHPEMIFCKTILIN